MALIAIQVVLGIATLLNYVPSDSRWFASDGMFCTAGCALCESLARWALPTIKKGGRVRVCLGQINTTPGDFEGNLDAMLRGMRGTATAVRADCLSELSIPVSQSGSVYQPRYIEGISTPKTALRRTRMRHFGIFMSWPAISNPTLAPASRSSTRPPL